MSPERGSYKFYSTARSLPKLHLPLLFRAISQFTRPEHFKPLWTRPHLLRTTLSSAALLHLLLIWIRITIYLVFTMSGRLTAALFVTSLVPDWPMPFRATPSRLAEMLTCTITPSDGTLNGPSITVEPVTLHNISTRLSVGTGNNALIGGFIVSGSVNKSLLIRALGPTLTGFGMKHARANPTLELRTAPATWLRLTIIGDRQLTRDRFPSICGRQTVSSQLFWPAWRLAATPPLFVASTLPPAWPWPRFTTWTPVLDQT